MAVETTVLGVSIVSETVVRSF